MAAPYSLNLDPSVAQQLADQGGTLLVLELPEGSYFGIDHMAFHCGPRFCGVKMLPPGPHFACYSVPGSTQRGGGMGPVTGFFFHVPATAQAAGSGAGGGAGGPAGSGGRGAVVVRRYSPQQELLLELPEEEAERYAAGIRRYEFDSGLAPYNLHAWQTWRELTSCLDPRVVDAIQPVGGHIGTAQEAAAEAAAEGGCGEGEEDGEGGPPSEAEVRLREQLLAGRSASAAKEAAAKARAMEVDGAGPAAAAGGQGDGAGAGVEGQQAADPSQARAAAAAAPGGSGRCFYTPLTRLVKTAGLTPAQLTALNLDRTAQLEAAAAGRWGGEVAALVGEMQFAFIAFVCGQSLQGFRQWRALVSLFLQCERGPLSSHVPAFTAFTAALRAQLAMALSDAHQNKHGQQQGAVGVEGCGGALGLWGPHGPLVEEVLVGGGGRGCFLRHHLAGFFEVLREAAGVEQGLAREAAELRALLSRTMGWQFDGVEVLGEDSDDEYAPVVVEGVEV